SSTRLSTMNPAVGKTRASMKVPKKGDRRNSVCYMLDPWEDGCSQKKIWPFSSTRNQIDLP
ncbi:MAG: hypothetical protein VX992_04675, partial [Acidobacteriota bacterium]|nr:hypothetical protein [Acidobacteriota bacterium]